MTAEPASFRDPSGQVFLKNGKVYRKVYSSYKKQFEELINSGLYSALTTKGLLIKHKEVTKDFKGIDKDVYKVLAPEQISFISYPYEWSFSQLKDAALTTLEVQKIALEHGMTLKDASAYNIQFIKGKPVLIDTLSFEKYNEGEPWIAYRQFCQHFLAPLALMSYVDVRLSSLMRTNIDGIPLDLANSMLPGKAKLKTSIRIHISIHSKLQKKYAGQSGKAKIRKVSKFAMLGLIGSLTKAVKNAKWEPKGTEWIDYYSFTNYSEKTFDQKKKLIDKYIKEVEPRSVWDLGGNNGLFSRIASDKLIETVSLDIDPASVEQSYRFVKEREEKTILPLVMDLTNPSTDLGWSNNERKSLTSRGKCDLAFALALVHHLAISNNVPLNRIASYFADLCKHLIIEFVPKDDSQVKILLSTRKDIFKDYNEKSFEEAFSQHYKIVKKEKIKGTKRTIYLMSGK